MYISLEHAIRNIQENNENDAKRVNVTNVGRPNTAPNNISSNSRLAKQGEIKTKIIDDVAPPEEPVITEGPIPGAGKIKDQSKYEKDGDVVTPLKLDGGKTPVDVNPKVNDSIESDDGETSKGKKAAAKANKEIGVKEEEQVTELSTQTMASYQRKAGSNKDHAWSMGDKKTILKRQNGLGLSYKRQNGLGFKKLTKEDEMEFTEKELDHIASILGEEADKVGSPESDVNNSAKNKAGITAKPSAAVGKSVLPPDPMPKLTVREDLESDPEFQKMGDAQKAILVSYLKNQTAVEENRKIFNPMDLYTQALNDLATKPLGSLYSEEKWIPKHMVKGGLHHMLGVPEGKKIPKDKIAKAEHSKDPLLRHRAIAAHNMEEEVDEVLESDPAFQQLDELSKGVVRRYIRKASSDRNKDRSNSVDQAIQKRDNTVGAKVPASEEVIDELSKNTVGSYIKKANVDSQISAASAEKFYQAGNKKGVKQENLRSEKREDGIHRAVNKLTGVASVPAKD